MIYEVINTMKKKSLEPSYTLSRKTEITWSLWMKTGHVGLIPRNFILTGGLVFCPVSPEVKDPVSVKNRWPSSSNLWKKREILDSALSLCRQGPSCCHVWPWLMFSQKSCSISYLSSLQLILNSKAAYLRDTYINYF